MLNKNSPIPLYYQLAEVIKEQVTSGELAGGMQLPAERDLSEQYGISRMTVRQAVQYLVRENVLVVKHGLGTFVAEPKLSYDPLHLMSFTDDMLQHGAQASSRVLEQVVVTPPAAISERLQMGASDTATKLVRLRLSDTTPLRLETVYVPTLVFPELVHEDLMTQSLYRLLFNRHNVQLNGSQQMLEAVPANEYETTLFGIEPCTSMILLEGVTYDLHDRPVEYYKAVFRGDRFKIQIDSRQHDPQSAGGRMPLLSVVMQ